MDQMSDTIFALSTASGRAGVAIVRISGPKSDEALVHFGAALPEPRYAALRTLRSGAEIIDQALVLRFDEGASFTGDRMVELHVHGGSATIGRVLRELRSIDGFFDAEPGQFTRRALASGQMDLTQVEALADLIDAQTEAQRQQAVALMGGALSDRIATWRDDLVRALALTEAAIDFADEEDAPVDVTEEVVSLIRSISSDIALLIQGASFGMRLRDGFIVALVGPPNVGKSSLINALAQRDIAITSPVAGTTRDVIEVSCDFSGLPVVVLDTAGIRHSEDQVEIIGINRALARAADADIRVFMASVHEPQSIPDGLWREGDILLWNKADLATGTGDVSVSATNGTNVDQFVQLVTDRLSGRARGSSVVARDRQVQKLTSALLELEQAEVKDDELRSAHLRQAIIGLDEIVGAVGAEEVLGEIFAQFCIGK
ncbi:MAG: tRNA uridine-5-carboxymethylaminomethyl(34) synthesis GTPase MnmE [Pseudomonadota bacterium]